MAKEKKPEEQPKGSPAWMSTYSDLMSLLFCLFVLLFAMSTIDAEKFTAIADALSSKSIIISSNNESILELVGNGILEMPTYKKSDNPSEQAKKAKDEMKSMASDFKTYFAENMLDEVVDIRESDYSITLNFKDGLLFDSGSAILKTDAIGVINLLANELLKFPDNDISITGHTDNAPINSLQFPSNWELSSSRAISVGKYLIYEMGVDPVRVETVGRGEFMPVVPNNSKENMAKNRRVEIRIISQYFSNI